MLEIIGPPESLPVLTQAPGTRCSTPADFKDIAYSPMLLLSAHFDASITADPEYHGACETGFEAYFEELVQWNEESTDLVIADHFHTRTEVMSFVARGIIRDCHLPHREQVPFSFGIGFVQGWLSALALTNSPLALCGLELLTVLVAQLQKVFS